jgi:hypothetical protein
VSGELRCLGTRDEVIGHLENHSQRGVFARVNLAKAFAVAIGIAATILTLGVSARYVPALA